MSRRVFAVEYRALGRWMPREFYDDRGEAEARMRFFQRRDTRDYRVREERDKYKTRFLKPVREVHP